MEHIYKIFLEQDRGTIMRQCMDADNLHRRLKKIIGQVQAIRCTGITGINCISLYW